MAGIWWPRHPFRPREQRASSPPPVVPEEAFRASELGIRERPTVREVVTEDDERESMPLSLASLRELAADRTRQRDAWREEATKLQLALEEACTERAAALDELESLNARHREAVGLLSDVDRIKAVGARVAAFLNVEVKR